VKSVQAQSGFEQGGNEQARAIARTRGVHRHTVQKYSALESAPEKKPRFHGAGALAPYEGTYSSASSIAA
jgi:hypothetical protein